MEVKRIKAKDTISLRHTILRPNQTREACYYPNDSHQASFHLGVYDQDELISIGSFYRETHTEVPRGVQYRLRGMATKPEDQGKGAGTMVIHKALDRLRSLNVDYLWCNARTSAQGYYDQLGFIKAGEVFDIPPIGPHIISYIKIEKH
ncbi:GNAT family N-acetyltransferase [Halobacillus locisalis]|uniref:GNAT family N-acetyltransferase n=1 Tax=Halobacillus locisalis TaxID=220753 RepID=A0A838CNF9_9BACI|nr:GNAT family N-acetyltransferase [Halobacillus locisalis]MBA2173275.1 GNAT family N-acetyltransferase [Halobacillus locisalis]